jgi:excisionase family DNA binding protein
MRSSTPRGSTVPALLNVHELSAVLGVPEATLYAWRTHGKGPRGIRVGRHLRYRPEDVKSWIEAQVDRLPNSQPHL